MKTIFRAVSFAYTYYFWDYSACCKCDVGFPGEPGTIAESLSTPWFSALNEDGSGYGKSAKLGPPKK